MLIPFFLRALRVSVVYSFGWVGFLGPCPVTAAEVPAVAQAIAELSAKDFTVRWYATYRLGLAGEPAATAPLAKLLADVDNHEYVRGGAAWALGRIGPAGAAVSVGPLTEALSSDLDSVRRHAAEALGRLGPLAAPAAAGLRARLDDRDPVVRIHSAAALWQIARHSPAFSFLVDALRKPGDPMRYDAALALAELGPDARPALPELLQLLGDADADTARAATVAIGHIGPAALGELKQTLADRNHPLRQRRAIAALEWIGPAATPLLIDALADREPSVRRTAARALGRLGSTAQSAVPSLMRTVNDPVEEVRQEAAGALREIRAPVKSEQEPHRS